jgi:hypothetical protein
MTDPNTPDDPQGLAGVSAAPPSTAPKWTRSLTRWWFWIPFMAAFWLLPLFKNLGASLPEPPPGADRAAEDIALTDIEGRELQLTDLKGSLKVVFPLRAGDSEQLERDFVVFREAKKHMRSMGPITVYLLLVDGADVPTITEFLDSMKARKPGSVFLLDHGGEAFSALQKSAADGTASGFLLDRHGRLRATYGPTEEEQNAFFRVITLLGNWVGSDPAPGEPVHR